MPISAMWLSFLRLWTQPFKSSALICIHIRGEFHFIASICTCDMLHASYPMLEPAKIQKYNAGYLIIPAALKQSH
jgi:hypothetical protein